MASIRARRGKLFVDFRYMNMRCRETTNLTDTPANRKKLAKIIEKMEAEITPKFVTVKMVSQVCQ